MNALPSRPGRVGRAVLLGGGLLGGGLMREHGVLKRMLLC